MVTRVKWLCDTRSMLSCGTVRGIIPAAHINAQRFRNVLMDVKSNNEIYFSDFVGYDVVVLQRMMGDTAVDICRRGRWNHKLKVVFDIDDALWMLPKSTDDPNFPLFQVLFPEQACDAMTNLMKDEVDHITTSTPELADSLASFIEPSRITIVENCVDPQFFNIEKTVKEKATFDLCWYAACGHNSNGVLLETIFGTLLNEFPNVRLHLIGAPQSFSSLRGLSRFGNRVELKDWVLYTNLGNIIKEYDLALCPCFDYPFTRCKSELKPIESSMSGLIPVMSDMPQFRRFASRVLSEDDANKLVVPNEAEAWISLIRSIIKHDYVPDMKSIQKKTIEEYGVQKGADKWCSFYSSLFQDRDEGMKPRFIL